MENCVFFVLALFLSTTLSLPPSSETGRFRSDYVYNAHTRAYYKLHIENRRGILAKETCTMEGAALMEISSSEDITQLHGMFKQFPDLGEYVYVAPDGHDHESAEEPSIINLTPESEETDLAGGACNVVTRKGEVESAPCYLARPFICKVELKDLPYDRTCDLYNKNYQYNATVGSCYRIPPMVASWNEAYADCRAQGSHLVVLNSETERAVVQSILQNSPTIFGSHASWFFYAGFRADKPAGNETVVYKTIFNQTLQEAGFAEWSPNEPNNYLGTEFCGTLFSNDGKLNDVDCSKLYAFVCEKEVPNNNVD